MADNAIDKLIEEMRDAKTALDATLEAAEEAEKRRRDAREEVTKAKVRCDMLDLTMKKHIHENMPVVQAKMIAHEEIEQIKAADRSFSHASVSAQGASATGIAQSASAQGASATGIAQSASAAINAQLASMGAAILSNAKPNGSLNLSV